MTWSACRPTNAFFPTSASALVTLVVEMRNCAALQNACVQLTVLNVERTAAMVPSRPTAPHWQQRCHQGLAMDVDPCPGQDLAWTDHLQDWAQEATQMHHLEQRARQGKLLESVRGSHLDPLRPGLLQGSLG